MMMFSQRSLVLGCLLLATAAAGCRDYSEGVQKHYEKWKAQETTDYVFVWEERCFCSHRGATRVTVRDGNIVSAVSTLSGLPEKGDSSTIDQLFEQALSYTEDGPDDFDASYDDQYGYMTEYSVDPDTNTADEEYGLVITCFAADTTASTACPLQGITAEQCQSRYYGRLVSDPDHARKCPDGDDDSLIAIVGDWEDSDEICCPRP